MKKYLLTVLSVVFSITLMGQDPFVINNLRYTVMNGNEVKVSAKDQHGNAINSSATNIVIPETVTNGNNTYTVTEIADDGFKQLHSLQEITIPRTCRSIGNYAFASCSALEGMHIPNPDCSLGTHVFQNCHNLSFINLPTNLETIPEHLLENCIKLRSIVIPENVTSIGSQAFGQAHDAQIVFLGCGDNGNITIATDAFSNNQRDNVEFFCIETYEDNTRSVQFVNAQGGGEILLPSDFNNATLFGVQLEKLYVPCGMETYYAQGLFEDPQTSLNKINEGELCLAVTQRNGNFCLPETWRGYDKWIVDNTNDEWTEYDGVAYPSGESDTYEDKEAWLKNNPDDPDDDRYPNFMPRDPMDPFIIKHTVTLKHRRDIYAFTSVNNGILVIDATGGDKDGQLVERDSAFFDNNIILDIEYTMDGNNIVKTYPITTTTDISSLLNNPTTGETEGDYRIEHIFNNNDNIYIRDTKTRYLLSLEKSGEDYVFSEVVDRDYYRIDNNNNTSTIYYYGYGGEDPVSAVIDYLTTVPNGDGFSKEVVDGRTLIKHQFTYNGNHPATAIIDGSTGDVTLRGTDYTYGHVRMHQNLAGEIHVKVPAVENSWNFVGAPFNVYDLYAVRMFYNPHGSNSDASAVRFDYTTNDWETVLSYGEDTVRPGEGFLAWPFYSGGITFSTKRDYGSVGGGLQRVYTDFVLNNDTVYVEKDIANNNNKWMALANPYPAKLCVNAFVSDNTATLSNSNPDPAQSNTTIQGQGVYILNATSSSWSFMDSDDNYDLGVGQGFFVNVANSGTNKIMFTKSQIHEYIDPQCEHGVNHSAKSSSQRGFIRLSMIADNVASELLFAHNEDAQQYYDIYDANKLFAMERMTEPYFVTDGIKLVKEEVKEVPYYATMNVRSYEEKEVKFRADYIPEGYAVSIIDGEETIDLNPGVEYTTEVSVGENANRFKVLVKKSVGLNDVEELAIDITNSNRIVNISTNETNLQIEVYNALGQKVLSTHSLNFSLNEVSAGAYMIKAFNSKGSKTQKIIIK
jgi:hypothetical protein